MQKVEQGEIDLDADINTYLDFEIPERDGEPVTMRNVMTHTTGFEEQVKGLMGVGVEIIGGLAPAGSMSSTGADMANFMIAHLQKGAFKASRILEEETAELMHGTPLTILPEVNRMLLGFYETNRNGRRVIAHGGDTQWFHTYLHLFIDDGVGIYMSFNSSGEQGAVGYLRTSLFQQFADRYLPGDEKDGELDEDTSTFNQNTPGLIDNVRPGSETEDEIAAHEFCH
jgi:CubicO group peptidase (beta-lactamase class C family)